MLPPKRVLILGIALIVAVAASAGVVAARTSPSQRISFHTRVGAPFPPDPQELTDLRDAALRIAANTGDPHPSSGRVWATSRSRATAILDDTNADTDQPSYVMVLQGDFVANDAPRPAGAPAPTGTVLTLVLDPSTGEVTDFGVHEFAPDMSTLGPGADLGVSS